MTLPNRIHILGASGAGTSTLGHLIARHGGHHPLDTDDFFWAQTIPPYQQARPRPDRLAGLRAAISVSPRWVLSGSLCGWGDELIPSFDLVIFVTTPTSLRVDRLRARESRRFGDVIEPGGSQHDQHRAFLDWATTYDTAEATSRSRAGHEAWLRMLPVPVRRIENSGSLSELMDAVNLL